MTHALRGLLRQGDVLLVPVRALPEGTRSDELARDDGSVLLAHGEATGHAHVIRDPRARVTLVEGVGRFLRVEGVEPVELTHEEHLTIPVSPGVYEVRRQREYAPGPRRPPWVRD